MRIGIRPQSPIEVAALAGNLAPVPAGDGIYGQVLARSVGVAAKVGLFAAVARRPLTAEELAGELELRVEGLRLLADVLLAHGYLDLEGSRYGLTKRARKWLDPASKTYVGTFVAHGADYWAWWQNLEDLLRTGDHVELHGFAPDDPSWRTYITGQYELARLSRREVARALKLQGPRRILDVAGGHGGFASELCRRHPGAQATVVDLPGSAAVGRELIAAEGMADRVRFLEGDAFAVDLEGPYDAALAFDIVHHFHAERNVELLTRIGEALRPGGTLAVLDLFRPEPGSKPSGDGAMLGLFFHLTSGADTYSRREVAGWLERAGFARPREVTVRALPGQAILVAARR